MLSKNHFDFIIIGNGLAGLQLALEFSKDTFFDNKQFALIDVSNKTKNDKTWCFWEKGKGKWDHIVFKNWSTAQFYSSNKTLNLDLNPYKYKMIRSSDFYQNTKARLSTKENFHFIIEKVTQVEEKELVHITTENTSYSANHVFDSRISDSFFNKEDNYTRINQHFKGWIIETKNDVFNPEMFFEYSLLEMYLTTMPIIIYATMHLYNHLGKKIELYYINIGLLFYLFGSTVIFLLYELLGMFKVRSTLFDNLSIINIVLQYIKFGFFFYQWKLIYFKTNENT